ncbi:neutral zinc metallopeptidase [Pseudomonadota bacterium]
MRWRGRRQSSNIEDRRNTSTVGLGTGRGGAGLVRLLPVLFRFLGVKGTVVVVLGLVAFNYFGGNLGDLSAPMKQSEVPASTKNSNPDQTADDEPAQFVSIVLADTEDTWTKLFRLSNRQYREPGLVLFRGATRSACGLGQAAMGPFYCPGDEKVYIDLSFYDDLRKRHNAPGDFAQAYVIAHEVGHHVQTLLGISEKTHKARKKLPSEAANKLSVQQELQADCLAGIWAHHADRSRDLLESGDIEEGLNAASAIGDDRLQRQTQGYVTPESFTHGSSAQRVRWFSRGFKSGQLEDCDTFNATQL